MVMIVWQWGLQLPVQSVPVTTKVESFNTVHGKVNSIQHYVIKFVSDLGDLRQVGGFLQVLQCPLPTNCHGIQNVAEISLIKSVKHHKPTNQQKKWKIEGVQELITITHSACTTV